VPEKKSKTYTAESAETAENSLGISFKFFLFDFFSIILSVLSELCGECIWAAAFS